MISSRIHEKIILLNLNYNHLSQRSSEKFLSEILEVRKAWDCLLRDKLLGGVSDSTHNRFQSIWTSQTQWGMKAHKYLNKHFQRNPLNMLKNSLFSDYISDDFKIDNNWLDSQSWKHINCFIESVNILYRENHEFLSFRSALQPFQGNNLIDLRVIELKWWVICIHRFL